MKKKHVSHAKSWISMLNSAGIQQKTSSVPAYNNLYAYASNNPIRYTDPDGRDVILRTNNKNHPKFEKNFNIAINYLEKSKFAKQIINKTIKKSDVKIIMYPVDYPCDEIKDAWEKSGRTEENFYEESFVTALEEIVAEQLGETRARKKYTEFAMHYRILVETVIKKGKVNIYAD